MSSSSNSAPNVIRSGTSESTRSYSAEHKIDTGSACPVRLPPYRLPHAYRSDIHQELQEMLAQIIKPSTSEWAAPIVLVKKDGSLRLCVDYHRRNSASLTDAYPMPRIDNMIDQLGKASFITTLDLTQGYWQVPVANDDRHNSLHYAIWFIPV